MSFLEEVWTRGAKQGEGDPADAHRGCRMVVAATLAGIGIGHCEHASMCATLA